MKVLIAGGGTGGHVYPGIAVAEELHSVLPDAAVTFVGTRRGLEAQYRIDEPQRRADAETARGDRQTQMQMTLDAAIAAGKNSGNKSGTAIAKIISEWESSEDYDAGNVPDYIQKLLDLVMSGAA